MRKLMIALLFIVAIPVAAIADPMTDVGFRGWGPRLGVTMQPDQFHFGAHLDFGNFAEHVRFQPNFEIGFGDNLTLFAINAEAAYRFASRWDVWTPYLGGGVGANIFTPDGGGDTQTELGVNALGGIEKGLANGHRFFIEGKFGFADSPDFKATAGWTFFH